MAVHQLSPLPQRIGVAHALSRIGDFVGPSLEAVFDFLCGRALCDFRDDVRAAIVAAGRAGPPGRRHGRRWVTKRKHHVKWKNKDIIFDSGFDSNTYEFDPEFARE